MCDEAKRGLNVAREAQKAIDKAWKILGISWKIYLVACITFSVASFYVAQNFFNTTSSKAVQAGSLAGIFFTFCELIVLTMYLKKILAAFAIKIAEEEKLGKRKSELVKRFEAFVMFVKRCVKLCMLFFVLVFSAELISGAKIGEALYAGSSVIIVFVFIVAIFLTSFQIRLYKN